MAWLLSYIDTPGINETEKTQKKNPQKWPHHWIWGLVIKVERDVGCLVVEEQGFEPFLLFSSASGVGKRGEEDLVLLTHVLDERGVWHGRVVLARIVLHSTFDIRKNERGRTYLEDP